MGVEEIGVAAGAEVGGEDIFFTYTAGEEVLVAGFPDRKSTRLNSSH